MRPIFFMLMLFALTACGAAAAALPPLPTPDPVAAGGRVFLVQCGSCHTISDVGSELYGPRLSTMAERAKAQPDPKTWLRSEIINPSAAIAPGYQAGMMPVNYGQSLRADELDALVTYMLKDEG